MVRAQRVEGVALHRLDCYVLDVDFRCEDSPGQRVESLFELVGDFHRLDAVQVASDGHERVVAAGLEENRVGVVGQLCVGIPTVKLYDQRADFASVLSRRFRVGNFYCHSIVRRAERFLVVCEEISCDWS